MDVTCFSTGRVRGKRAERGVWRYLPGGWSDETRPVNVFVVEHHEGLCLFDTGQTARAAAKGYFPRWHPFHRLARFELGTADEAAMHVEPDLVRWVVLSHLHTDHVGGLGAFPGAEVLVSRVEWERAQGLAGRLRGYLPGRWPSRLEPTLLGFEDGPVGPFAASHDLAGDGRLLAVPLPGHTPGHLALLVRADDRSVLLAGDAVPSSAELESLDPRIARFCGDQGIALLTAHDPHALQGITSTAPYTGG